MVHLYGFTKLDILSTKTFNRQRGDVTLHLHFWPFSASLTSVITGMLRRSSSLTNSLRLVGQSWTVRSLVAAKEGRNADSSEAPRKAPASVVSPEVSGKTAQRLAIGIFGSVGALALYYGLTDRFSDQNERTTFTNWSGTHEVTPWLPPSPFIQSNPSFQALFHARESKRSGSYCIQMSHTRK